MKSIRIGSVELDLLTQVEALKKIDEFLVDPELNFVLTPNAGQLATYKKNNYLREFLTRSNLRLIDGWPLALAVSLAEGKKWPRVTGSDLLPKVFSNLSNEVRVGIIGGNDKNLTRDRLKKTYPNLNLVLVDDSIWNADQKAADQIALLCEENRVTLLVLALGHPKQELIASYLSQGKFHYLRVVLCFGASVDFLVGSQLRAPKMLRTLGLEWFYRLLTNPQKFAKRYLTAIWPSLVLIITALRRRFF